MAKKLPVTAIADELSVQSRASDANGFYTIAEFSRKNGTLFMRSTMKDPDVSGNYQKLDCDYFGTDGITFLYKTVWSLTWDGNGNISKKVVQ